MKVVAYSMVSYEKEYLAKANQKKHDITLIANPLSAETALYAEGKDAVIVFANYEPTDNVFKQLALMGIRFIAAWPSQQSNTDKQPEILPGIKLAQIPVINTENPDELQKASDQIINLLDLWQQNKCVGNACVCARNCRSTKPDYPLNIL